MRVRVAMLVCALLVVRSDAYTFEQSTAVSQNLDRLRSSLEAPLRFAGGVVGVAIKHLETNVSIDVNGDEPFPMASTFKLPVLVELHAGVNEGRIRWDEMVDVTSKDQHLGSGDITPLFDPPGVKLSLQNLANLMMMISDNSAADICLARVGAAKVTSRMRSLGIEGIRVDRSCQELILDYQGRETAKLKDLARDDLREALQRDRRPGGLDRTAADERVAADPRDTATPKAMVALLEQIWRGKAVDRAASDAMLALLKRCRSGENRLRGLLPPAIEVAHKTGTLGGVVNDVGIIYLPNNAGHVAIAVMSKRTRAPLEDVERAIAHIARFAYDYFLFTADASSATSGSAPRGVERHHP